MTARPRRSSPRPCASSSRTRSSRSSTTTGCEFRTLVAINGLGIAERELWATTPPREEDWELARRIRAGDVPENAVALLKEQVAQKLRDLEPALPREVRVKRGLVFGKFLPLHRGHQLMIETALSQVDDLTIVVYDSHRPDDDRMSVELRLSWLRELYPDVENILALEDPLPGQEDTDDPGYAEVYARGLTFLGRFDHVFSSEPGYERFAELLGATHVLVDAARTLVPTSGTVIRSDPYAYRGWMDPLVYASLIERVVFVGTESTGKSTLAQADGGEAGARSGRTSSAASSGRRRAARGRSPTT